MPKRLWIRLIHGGAQQLASPERRMNAGTSRPRISVASITIASARPMPNILMNVTPLSPNEANVTASSAAAAVTMRPVRSRPVATAWVLSTVRSYSSLMRDSRNTS